MLYITKEEEDKITDNGLFTGSRKFNCYTDTSDWDFVFLFSDFKHLLPQIAEKVEKDLMYRAKPYTEAVDNFESVICYQKDKKINIILVDSEIAYAAWKYATDCFVHVQQPKFKNKDQRKFYFELLKLSYMAVKADTKLYTPRIINDIFGKRRDEKKFDSVNAVLEKAQKLGLTAEEIKILRECSNGII